MYKSIILIFTLVAVRIQGSIRPTKFTKEARIFGGDLVQPHEYPFAILALIITVDDDDFVNGGVLISDKHILTTANHFYNAAWARISLGLHNYEDERTDVIFTTEDLAQFLSVHEQFNPGTLENNIAILKMKESIQFTDKVQSIAFLEVGLNDVREKKWTKTIIGWGKSEDSQLTFPRHANVSMLPTVICKHYYPSQSTSSTFCSDGALKTGACSFDEGGPLIATSTDGSRALVGLISFFGPLGCNQGWPTVYVNIANYLDWIEKRANLKQQQLKLI